MEQSVEYEVADGVAMIGLNRPDRLNALDISAKRRLAECWSAAEADSSVRVAVIWGRGRAFCAGSDLGEIESRGPADTMTVLCALPNVVAPFGKPVIAALHGHVLGMGLNLALHCDIRIGHPDMRLGFPEIHHGMISAAGAVVLPSVVGVSRALEMLLLGDSIPAEAAKEIGIVSHLAEDPRSVAREMATRIARFDPRAVRASLRLARLGAGPASARFVEEMQQARDSLEDPI